MDDPELEIQAQAMAEKALAALPEGARAAKIAKVKEGILKRLIAQAALATPPAPATAAPAEAVSSQGGATPAPPPGQPGQPPPPAGTPPPPPAPPEDGSGLPEKLPGIEVLGDEAWYADPTTRRSMREKVIAAHAAQKILVAAPATEIRRICPGPGRVLAAGGVLRLGGSTLGGFGEADINYAYRQLSRALHPDKNPDVPEAHDAFKRLAEASQELKEGLEQSRNVLKALCTTMGTAVTPEMLERPQEALFAEATRMLHAILALTSEGEVSGPAMSRSLAAFTISHTWVNCRPQLLLSEWFDQNRLLDHFGGPHLRTAYDCAPKRYRAQFLCALNRATLAEAKRNNDCIRGNWQSVMMQFPEMSLWRDLLEKVKVRVWTPDAPADAAPKKRSMWDDEDGSSRKNSSWAEIWRNRIRNVLPRGIDSFVSSSDKEVRLLCAAIWSDIAEWARGEGDAARPLSLFTAEATTSPEGAEVPPTDEWAFVPASDLLLVLAEGIVGITAEGLGAADAKPGHERITFAEAMEDKKPEEKKEKDDEKKSRRDEEERSRTRDRSRDRRRVQKDKDGKPMNDPDFNWEEVWRNRVSAGKHRSRRSPTPRGRGRRNSRSRERRRSRSRQRRPRVSRERQSARRNDSRSRSRG
eukprot:TRINITY_DN27343_c0_g2_i1.p1 TRINITY_DN27343_c0_g2~~TRINITY_DN27343_c0_g2_i1.p1  ORF type:complete len:640 (-),score=124.67 TRINITY_DN27343_c0_g2_i1:63-1982(-)